MPDPGLFGGSVGWRELGVGVERWQGAKREPIMVSEAGSAETAGATEPPCPTHRLAQNGQKGRLWAGS